MLASVAQTIRVPLLVCAMGETTGALHRATLAKAGLATFATPAQAVRGFQHLVRDRRNRAAARELPPSAVLAVAPDRNAVRGVFAQVRRSGRLALFQDEALDVLAAYGIPGVPTRAVARAEDAPDAASLLGFPVVVKLRQAVPPRERPPGALALDLHDAGEAEDVVIGCELGHGLFEDFDDELERGEAQGINRRGHGRPEDLKLVQPDKLLPGALGVVGKDLRGWLQRTAEAFA